MLIGQEFVVKDKGKDVADRDAHKRTNHPRDQSKIILKPGDQIRCGHNQCRYDSRDQPIPPLEGPLREGEEIDQGCSAWIGLEGIGEGREQGKQTPAKDYGKAIDWVYNNRER